MRTLLLGDIGNRLDIEDTEREIGALRRSQSIAEMELGAREMELAHLKREVEELKLATQALTRYLVSRKVVDANALADFIRDVDAEDGRIDGRMELDDSAKRLRFSQGGNPGRGA
ncbi:MAG: hypothetical protein ACSHYB_07125 [Roseibacillus sp.]